MRIAIGFLASWLFLATTLSAQVQVTVTGTNIPCFGQNSGTATATGSGGWAPYTYLWSTGATTQTITGLSAGTYSVTVTDIDLGYAVGSITITQPPMLGVQVYGESQICGIVPDGKATAVPFGGTAPYTYLWSNGGTTAQITGLAQGTYTVTVTDLNGCTAAGSTTVYFWDEGIWIMDSTVQIKCFGQNNGSITALPMSGTPPYTFQWSTGSTNATIANLAPGTYTVTASDANGCSNTHMVTITQPPALSLSMTTTQGICGLAGSATVSVSGGTPPYMLLWNTGATTSTITVMPGTYTVTITDANLCSNSASATVTGTPNTINVSTSVTSNAGCTVGGGAQATASGGSGNYSYSWSGGQNTAAIANVAAGNYTVTVVDITTGCTGSATVNVPSAPALSANATVVTNATCLTGGSATVNVVGGTPPYTYKWDNNQTTQTATNLGAGPHSVTVTDSKGCVAIAAVTIAQTQGPTVTAQVLTNATCVAGGSANATATGGGGNYAYIWSNGQSTQTATNLAPGTHTVTATDVNGCSASASVMITQPAAPTAVISASTAATCTSGGSATAGATGGTTPYSFKWSHGPMVATVNNLSAGTYTVTVTDAASCTATAVVSIAAPLPPNVVITGSTNANCNQPGSATATATGGGGNYTYLWSTGATTSTASLNAGTYTVTVTASNGCSATASVTIGLTNNGIKIGDYVWYDDDQDGYQHPSETNGVSNITVKLWRAGVDGIFGNADDVLIGTTTTNAGGYYEFTCVTPGTYQLSFTGIPSGYQWTGKDKGGDDCKDSDVKSNGRTDAFNIVAGQLDNLCFDAGIHTVCVNILNAGVICCDQTICEGQTPMPFYEVQPPAGAPGPFEFQWMQLVNMGPFGTPTWVAIPGAVGPTYQPGALFATSHFMRCARSQGCVTFLESNIVKVTVKAAGSPGCGPFVSDFVVSVNPTNGVNLSWITLPENAQYLYAVQQSTDNINWEIVTTVMGNQDPSGPNQYQAVDPTPALGLNYYRIKRSSTNGADAYSEVRSIEISDDKTGTLIITPNPASDFMRIRNTVVYDQDVTIDFTTMSGQSIHSLVIPAGSLENIELPLTNLPQGMYIARINFGTGEHKTLKLTKF